MIQTLPLKVCETCKGSKRMNERDYDLGVDRWSECRDCNLYGFTQLDNTRLPKVGDDSFMICPRKHLMPLDVKYQWWQCEICNKNNIWWDEDQEPKHVKVKSVVLEDRNTGESKEGSIDFEKVALVEYG